MTQLRFALALPLLLMACGGADNAVEKAADVSDVVPQDSYWPAGELPSLIACTDDADCSDDNQCTLDRCHRDGTCHFDPQPGASCDDGNACTKGDTCSDEAICQPGKPKACDDLLDCTVDGCDPDVGCTHESAVDGTSCDDKKLCTTGDICQSGECVGTTPLCDDGNDCTADSCQPDTGECTHIKQSNFPCDDQNACTNGELCSDGLCTGGSEVDCDDGNPCTVDGCAELPRAEGGGCTHEPDVGAPCDDSNPCSVDDACNGEGICLGSGGSCDDDNPCTVDICSPVDGCYHEPANGGICDDGDPCTGTGACFGGVCQPGVALNCDDGVACTVDGCDESGSCTHEPDDPGCDDELFCNGAEFCDLEFGCQDDTPPETDDGIDCTADSCLEEADIIQHIPQHFMCDDSVPCTDDFCHVEQGCLNTPKVCDDSNPCTQDGCDEASGECLFVPLGECCIVDSDCVSNDPCLGGVCDAVDNQCSFQPLLCNDHDPCTSDSCEGGCQHVPVADCAAECETDVDCFFAANDLDLCTVPTCTAGQCTYPARTCDDGLICTEDLCFPELGCRFPSIPWCQEPCATDADCASGDACDTAACVEGTCTNLPDLCDDGLACTGGECHPDTGLCQLFECPACTCPSCESDADCDDANLCTHDVCLVPVAGEPGQCRHVPLTCNDGNPCTKDLCLAKQGCHFALQTQCTGCQNDAQCQDDTLCTTDTCVNAQCVHAWACE